MRKPTYFKRARIELIKKNLNNFKKIEYYLNSWN